MNRLFSKFFLLAFTLSGVQLAVPTGAQADARSPSKNTAPPAVTAFYANPDNCAGMVSVIENQTADQARAFETDIDKAISALQSRNRKLDRSGATSQLRKGCEAHLAWEAKHGTTVVR